MNRMSPALLLITIIGWSISPAQSKGARYAILDLATPGSEAEALQQARAINNAGEVLGNFGGGIIAVLPTGERIKKPEGVTFIPTALNDAGVIIGRGTFDLSIPVSGDSDFHLMIYQNGVVTDAGFIRKNMFAAAINAQGEIVGSTDDGPDSAPADAFVYQGGMYRLILSKAGAYAINAHGKVAGEAYSDGSDDSRAFLAEEGRRPVLFKVVGATQSRVTHLNDSGEIAGELTGKMTNHEQWAFVQKGGGYELISPPKSLDALREASIDGLNNLGQAVGTFYDGRKSEPFLHEKGRTVLLQDLVEAKTRWKLRWTSGINDHGWILGNGVNPDGRMHGFLLIPNPAVSVEGPSDRTVHTSSVTLHGTTAGDLVAVMCRGGGLHRAKLVHGVEKWRVTVPLIPGRNTFTLLALDVQHRKRAEIRVFVRRS